MPLSGSIAEKSGIMSGDTLVTLNNITPHSYREVSKIIENNTPIVLELKTVSGALKTLTLTPESGKIGVFMSYQNLEFNTGATLAPQ